MSHTKGASQAAPVVKNLPANAGDTRDTGLIPGLGRSPGGQNGKHPVFFWGFHDDSDSKESACHVGDWRSILGLGRYPGEGNGKPLQYSCLENPMDKGYSPQRGGHD